MRGSALLLMTLSCGAQQSKPAAGDPSRAVALGEWCSLLTQTMCIRAGSCMGSIEIANSCTDTAMTSCLAGRPNDTPSGHNDAELRSCVDTMQNAPCDGYMTAVASHAECQAK